DFGAKTGNHLTSRGKNGPILGFCQINFLKKLADAKCQRWVTFQPDLEILTFSMTLELLRLEVEIKS
ncbi:MAG: hypothetical protein SVM80_12605, partial [Halobacteriota archaeon]|nr:hypothetical protein [Halobacteriota archaeon]